MKDKSFIFELATSAKDILLGRLLKDIPSVARFVLLGIFPIVLAAKSLESDEKFGNLEFHCQTLSRSSIKER